MTRKVEVIPYDPAWKAKYVQEVGEICALLGEEVVAAHHIGSTSIPGLCAKPIIDILLVVRSVDRLDLYHEDFIERGYLPKGEHGIPGRRFFMKGTDEVRTFHIHAFEAENPEVERHLRFRNYMIAHPDEAEAYGKLKSLLAQKYPEDIDAYIAGKNDFIREIDRKALDTPI